MNGVKFSYIFHNHFANFLDANIIENFQRQNVNLLSVIDVEQIPRIK